MSELTEVVNNVKITYKYKNRKYDARHALFIFSGFGSEGRQFTYDFEKALQECPAHVIWIKDDFNGACSYYLCQHLDFSIEKAVIAFIERMLQNLGVNKCDCTLAGFSKGGSAALYFGIKYNFTHIVSTVPQFHIGSYIRKSWPMVASHMSGEVNDENTDYLDSLLPGLVLDDNEYQKNIYLLTSEADVQYQTDIQPYKDYFNKYNNFNLFMANSRLVREHNQVTSYHVPLLLGIFYSLAQGAVPRYGICNLEADNALHRRPVLPEPYAVLKRIAIHGNVIFPEGISVLKGVSCAEYDDIYVDLVLHDNGREKVYRIAKAHRSILTRQLYEDGFVNYDKGWFCTHKFQGLDLSELDAGTYHLSLDITCQKQWFRKALGVDAAANDKTLASSESIEMYSKNGCVYLVKKS